MAFGQNIVFNLSQKNLGSPQPGLDYVSGMIFTSATLPIGFSYSVAKQLFSVSNAESLGILGDYSDETKSTSVLTVTGTASVGDRITVTMVEPDVNSATNVITLGTYIATSIQGATAFAANLANAINYTGSGYTALASAAAITVTTRPGLGALINSMSLTSADNGGLIRATPGTFSGGVSSTRIFEHYQISEFFRTNINGALWIMYTNTLTFDLLNVLQNQANNEIRQTSIYNNLATSNSTITSDLDAIQSYGLLMASNYAPMSIIYSPNLYAYADLSLLPNLRQRNDWFVSCLIGQDGSETGAYLSLYGAKSVPCHGAVLGLLSKSLVSDNIGCVGDFSITTGPELSVPAFANKQLYSNLFATSYALLNQLDASGYMFLMTRPGIAGTWVNDTPTAVSKTSDFSYIERVRTIYKVLRESYTGIIPLVNSKLVLNKAGMMTPITISIFSDAVGANLKEMVRKTEISDYQVLIDSSQNVQTTSTVEIIIRIIGIGIARNIVIDLGFALSI